MRKPAIAAWGLSSRGSGRRLLRRSRQESAASVAPQYAARSQLRVRMLRMSDMLQIDGDLERISRGGVLGELEERNNRKEACATRTSPSFDSDLVRP